MVADTVSSGCMLKIFRQSSISSRFCTAHYSLLNSRSVSGTEFRKQPVSSKSIAKSSLMLEIWKLMCYFPAL